MNPQDRKYFVIVVHYGDIRVTRKAVDLLISCENGPEKVIVVSNNDSEFEYKEGSRVMAVKAAANKGYAAGLNMGLGVALSVGVRARDIIVCMNNDVMIRQDTFKLLKKWWGEGRAKVLAGTAITEGKKRMVGVGRVNLFSGRAKVCSTAKSCLRKSWFSTSYVHGAFMSATYDTFTLNRGIPEKYYMYWEDCLLSRQMTRRGVKLGLAEEVVVDHVQTVPTGKQDGREYYQVRNGALYLEQETTLVWQLYWRLANRVRLCYHYLRGGKNTVIRGIKDAKRGVVGAINR